jgi:hypothetical protein
LGGAEPPSAVEGNAVEGDTVERDAVRDTDSEPVSALENNVWDAITKGENILLKNDKVLTIVEEDTTGRKINKPIFRFSRIKGENGLSTCTLVSQDSKFYDINIKDSVTAYKKFIKTLSEYQHAEEVKYKIEYSARDGQMPGSNVFKFFDIVGLNSMEINLIMNHDKLTKIVLKANAKFEFTERELECLITIDETTPITLNEFINVFKEAGISISDRKTFKERTISFLSSAPERLRNLFT